MKVRHFCFFDLEWKWEVDILPLLCHDFGFVYPRFPRLLILPVLESRSRLIHGGIVNHQLWLSRGIAVHRIREHFEELQRRLDFHQTVTYLPQNRGLVPVPLSRFLYADEICQVPGIR